MPREKIVVIALTLTLRDTALSTYSEDFPCTELPGAEARKGFRDVENCSY